MGAFLLSSPWPSLRIALGASLVAAALAGSVPAGLAGTPVDVDDLTALIKKTGTDIVHTECKDKTSAGSYTYSQQKRINRLTVCINNIDLKDSDALWELLAHEATHIMQRCYGGSIVQEEFLPRIIRNLKASAPHYAQILNKQYRHSEWVLEAEAFAMELQRPEVVKEWLTDFCLTPRKKPQQADRPAADSPPEKPVEPPAAAPSPSPPKMKGILYLEPRR